MRKEKDGQTWVTDEQDERERKIHMYNPHMHEWSKREKEKDIWDTFRYARLLFEVLVFASG